MLRYPYATVRERLFFYTTIFFDGFYYSPPTRLFARDADLFLVFFFRGRLGLKGWEEFRHAVGLIFLNPPTPSVNIQSYKRSL
jgi:hypothetical protein